MNLADTRIINPRSASNRWKTKSCSMVPRLAKRFGLGLRGGGQGDTRWREILESPPMKMIHTKLSKTASPPVTWLRSPLSILGSPERLSSEADD